jgi:hypothetical protein
MSSHRWLQPSPQRPSTFSPASSEGPGPTSDPADLVDGTARSSSPSDGHTRNPRKRPAEDLSQCAERTARNLRLKLESTEVLKAYGEVSAHTFLFGMICTQSCFYAAARSRAEYLACWPYFTPW